MALTTIASVKAQGGILLGDSSRDAQLRVLIEGVTSFVKQLLNRDLESQEYVEYCSGDGSPILMLNQYPVTQVSLVCIDGSGYFGGSPNSFPAALNLVEGVDYALISGAKGSGSGGFLRRVGANWPRPSARQAGVLGELRGVANGNIKVQYTAGYLVIPPAITMAVNALVLKQASMGSLGGAASSMGYEDARVSFFDPKESGQMLGSIESILANYRSVPV